MERGESIPVPGVVVLLIDGAGSIMARSLTNERGEFRVGAPAGGAYRLRTLRIGFQPVTSEVILLGIGQELTRQLELSGVRVSLDTVRIVDRGACRIARDSAAATFAIWEQVRTALTATQLTASSGSIAATIVGYERTLDRSFKRVRTQRSFVRSGYASQPWLSLTPDSLRRVGYVTTSAGDSVTYHAPGLEVLLSHQFLEDHCFRVTKSRDTTRLGMTFEPTRDRRRVPEIRGTLWLDRNSSELRAFEYTYVNVPGPWGENAGGDMEFVRMRNGAWVISRWNIRMPLVGCAREECASLSRVSAVASTTVRTTVLGLQVSGGELALAVKGGDTLWSRPPLQVLGTVSDSTTGARVASARVSLEGTNLEDTSDANGRFMISGVLPGYYTLVTRTASLDSLGAVIHSELTVTDSASTIAIRVPTASELATVLCRRPQIASVLSREGVVLGRVEIRGDSLPPRNVRVLAEWADTGRKMTITHEARTNDRGMFRMCGVPINNALFLRAVTDSGLASVAEVTIPAQQRFARVDLVVDREASASASFSGFVLVDSTNQPIPNAEVALPALDKNTLTNEQGAFRLLDLPVGTHEVVVRRIGYGPLNANISFAPNETVERRVFLTKAAVLDTISVIESAIIRDFEENRRIGLGHFLTRADLAKIEHLSIPAIFGQIPSAHVIADPSNPGRRYLMSRRKGCLVNVYLDRMLIYSGKEAEPLFDLNTITPERIESIEFYTGPAQTPLRYSTLNSQCGVVVIHSRR